MSDYNDRPSPSTARRATDTQRFYSEASNIEAHIIADMLRIESLTNEVREFKQDTKTRFDRIENWVISIVGLTVTTLLATVGSILFKVFL